MGRGGGVGLVLILPEDRMTRVAVEELDGQAAQAVEGFGQFERGDELLAGPREGVVDLRGRAFLGSPGVGAPPVGHVGL